LRMAFRREPHSPAVTNPHVRIGQITPALSPWAW
jgi:hypothetical protein